MCYNQMMSNIESPDTPTVAEAVPMTDAEVFAEMHDNLTVITDGAAELNITEAMSARIRAARALYVEVGTEDSRWRGILQVSANAIANAKLSGSASGVLVIIDEYMAADPSIPHDELY